MTVSNPHSLGVLLKEYPFLLDSDEVSEVIWLCTRIFLSTCRYLYLDEYVYPLCPRNGIEHVVLYKPSTPPLSESWFKV